MSSAAASFWKAFSDARRHPALAQNPTQHPRFADNPAERIEKKIGRSRPFREPRIWRNRCSTAGPSKSPSAAIHSLQPGPHALGSPLATKKIIGVKSGWAETALGPRAKVAATALGSIRPRASIAALLLGCNRRRDAHVRATICLQDGAYEAALAQKSGRKAVFQSGIFSIFFSRSSTSASRCRSGSRFDGKPGFTSTRARAFVNVSRDMEKPFEVKNEWITSDTLPGLSLKSRATSCQALR